MAKAWRTIKLIWMAKGVDIITPVDQSGEILIRVLRSSTCCIVQRFHGFLIELLSEVVSPWLVIRAAWFRNLYHF